MKSVGSEDTINTYINEEDEKNEKRTKKRTKNKN